MYHLTMQALCHVCNAVTRFNELTNKYGFQQTELGRVSGLFQRFSRPDDKRNEDNDDDKGNRDVIIPTLFNDDSRITFEDILHTYQKRLSYMTKFSWAIKDKAKFEDLVVQMREMNNGLESSLPRTMQSLLGRELIAGQPNDMVALREIESTMARPGYNNDYYNAAILKRRRLEQIRVEMDYLEGRSPVVPETVLKSMELDSSKFVPGEQEATRVLRLEAGKVQLKVLIEYKQLPTGGHTTGQGSVLFQRFINLIDLLRITQKSSRYRVLDCKGFVRHVINSQEYFGLVFALPPRIAMQPKLRFSSLQELLRAEQAKVAPKYFPLEHRFRLAARLANSVAYMHFAGWLHRNLTTENVICFHAEDEPSIDEPFLSGFAFSRPDNPREVSEFDVNTTSNLYRHAHYQMPQPTQKFRRSYDLYSLGIMLVEIGLWKRISTFWNSGFNAQAFQQHIIQNIVPLLGFYMGERYRDAVLACLDVERLNVQGDEGRRLSSAFSRTVVQQLESCEID
jgi:serine/threonine protein kinase